MKFFGKIGFASEHETSLGIHKMVPIEKEYFGDVIENTRRYETGSEINSDLKMQNQISIVADDYLHDHSDTIRYVVYRNTKWSVTSIKVSRPRIILTLGGVWNGE